MERSQGKEIITHIVNGKFEEDQIKSDRLFAEWTTSDVSVCKFEDTRSISLGNYEYAKVGMGISVGIELNDDINISDERLNEINDRIEGVVTSVLDREEACIRGSEVDFSEINLNDIGVRVSIWLSYGLTFKKNKTDSHKIDICLDRRLSDGSDFEEQLKFLQDTIGNRILEYKQRILGSGMDVGF